MIFYLFLLFGLFAKEISAQEIISVSGGYTNGNVGSVSYTIGQVVYCTNIGTNASEIQGAQQPYSISVVTELEENKAVNIECTVYPNPMNNFLFLNVKNCKIVDLTYQLYDNTGEKILNKKLDGSETIISFHNLVPAIYFLKITEFNKEIKVFKIIKNK